MSTSVRADKWLWATRFYRTRSAAATGCESGRIKRAGHPIKAATLLHPGDALEVPFHDGPGTRLIEITGLIDRRVAPPQARACYLEHTSPEVIEINRLALQEKQERRARGEQRRPTKRDRRAIDRYHNFGS